MSDFLTSGEAARKMGVGRKRMQALLRQGRIPGARMFCGRWMIPGNFSVLPGRRGPLLRVAKLQTPEVAGEQERASGTAPVAEVLEQVPV